MSEIDILERLPNSTVNLIVSFIGKTEALQLLRVFLTQWSLTSFAWRAEGSQGFLELEGVHSRAVDWLEECLGKPARVR